jgi:tetratricopeptide (TPR) repeat protein
MGQNDQAVRLFEASLKTVQGMQNETGKMAQMAALNNLGNVYHAISRYPEALKAYQERARLAQDWGDKRGEAAALNNIGDVPRLTGSDAAAREVIEKSLKIAQTAGNQVAEAVTWTSLGRVHQATVRYGDALEAYHAALRIAEPIGAIDTVFRVHNHIGDVYYVQKQWQPAAEAYRQSIVNIELLRAQTGEQSLQTSFFGEYTAPYYHLASSLLELQDAPQAFAVSEYAKAHAVPGTPPRLFTPIQRIGLSPLRNPNRRSTLIKAVRQMANDG